MDVQIRKCTPDDSAVVFGYIRELIDYHGYLGSFELTQDRLKKLIADNDIYSFLALADGRPAGILDCFCRYHTTLTGRAVLYIEDLFVEEKFRGMGIGKQLFAAAKSIAAETDCETIELKCAVWNENSAKFYESLSMRPDREWVTYTLERKMFDS